VRSKKERKEKKAPKIVPRKIANGLILQNQMEMISRKIKSTFHGLLCKGLNPTK
jgi:hypothetical protein